MLNETTGYYELNGLKDLTHQDMLEIYRYGIIHPYMNPGHLKGSSHIRTNMFLWLPGVAYSDSSNCFEGCYSLEVANTPHVTSKKHIFSRCYHLHTILPSSSYNYVGINNQAFEFCRALENIPATFTAKGNWNLKWSPKLTLQSLTNVITSCMSAGTQSQPYTLTLNPESYDKLTEELFEAAAEKFITIQTAIPT